MTFKIESSITQTYSRLSFRALGFFNIYLNGVRFGVKAPDATMLANSFDAICERIEERGRHVASFAEGFEATEIAKAVYQVIYQPGGSDGHVLGLPGESLRHEVYSRNLLMAPDGDAAFDDGSFILQFDGDDEVRLIGFKSSEEGEVAEESVVETKLPTALFYHTLTSWADTFEREWTLAEKVTG